MSDQELVDFKKEIKDHIAYSFRILTIFMSIIGLILISLLGTIIVNTIKVSELTVKTEQNAQDIVKLKLYAAEKMQFNRVVATFSLQFRQITAIVTHNSPEYQKSCIQFEELRELILKENYDMLSKGVN
jgi:hypothetical protein